MAERRRRSEVALAFGNFLAQQTTLGIYAQLGTAGLRPVVEAHAEKLRGNVGQLGGGSPGATSAVQ